MPAPSNEIEWTDQTVATLRLLWSEGHSTAEIGRRMDTTKNAIVGKAHRLDLPARPSPIRAASPHRRRVAPRITPPVLALPSFLPTALLPAPAPEPPPVYPAPPATARRAGTCQWPICKPGRAGFHLCGDEPVPGKPYCPSHCGRDYVRPRIAVDVFAAS